MRIPLTLVDMTEITAMAIRSMANEKMMNAMLPERKERRKMPMNGRAIRKKIPPMVN